MTGIFMLWLLTRPGSSVHGPVGSEGLWTPSIGAASQEECVALGHANAPYADGWTCVLMGQQEAFAARPRKDKPQ